MRENLDMFDGLISKCAWLKDTTELVQVLAAAIHSPLFEEESGFRAALALHFSLQRQAEELLEGMEELYKKFSIEEKLRRGDRPVSAQEGQ